MQGNKSFWILVQPKNVPYSDRFCLHLCYPHVILIKLMFLWIFPANIYNSDHRKRFSIVAHLITANWLGSALRQTRIRAIHLLHVYSLWGGFLSVRRALNQQMKITSRSREFNFLFFIVRNSSAIHWTKPVVCTSRRILKMNSQGKIEPILQIILTFESWWLHYNHNYDYNTISRINSSSSLINHIVDYAFLRITHRKEGAPSSPIRRSGEQVSLYHKQNGTDQDADEEENENDFGHVEKG